MNNKTIVFIFTILLFLNNLNSFSLAESYKPRHLSKQRSLVINKYKWEQVVDLGFENPNNLHAWSMKKYKGFIYVGTRNVIDGCQIYRSETGDIGSWKQVNINGFCNENKSEGARHMIIYKSLLWIITNSWDNGTQVWVTEGEVNSSNNLVIWKKANLDGFGQGKEIISSRSIAVYKGKLFVGSQSRDGHPLVYRYDGLTEFEEINPKNWSLVKDWFYDPYYNPELILAGEMANFTGLDGKDYLYVILINSVTTLVRRLRSNFSIWNLLRFLRTIFFAKSQIWRYDGFNWQNIDNNVFYNSNLMGSSFQVLNGTLYISTSNWFGGEIWKTVDGENWIQVSKRGFYRPFNFWIWKLFSYDNRLIIGTFNPVIGCEVWASLDDSPSKQSDFIRISRNGMDGSKIFNIKELPQDGARSFESFNGRLYTGTTNWVALQGFFKGTGCEVWRIKDIAS